MSDKRVDLQGGDGFSAHIRHLTTQALTARPDRQRKAQRALFADVFSASDFNGVLTVVNHSLDILAQAKDPRTLGTQSRFVGEFLQRTGEEYARRGNIDFRVSPATVRTTQQIIQQASALEGNRFVDPSFGEHFPVVKSFCESIQRNAGKESHLREGYVLQLFPRRELQETPEAAANKDRLINWQNSYIQARRNFDQDSSIVQMDQSKLRDNLIDILKQEPQHPALTKERFFTRKMAGISLEDIEAMPFPMTKPDYQKVTDYLVVLLESSPSLYEKTIIRDLFSHSTVFRDLNNKQPVIYLNNYSLLANINQWQENATYHLYAQHPQDKDDQTRRLFRAMDEPMALFFGGLVVPSVCIYAYNLDPTDSYNGREYKGGFHPLLDEAVAFYESAIQDRSNAVYLDEASRDYFMQVILPNLQSRAARLDLPPGLQRGLTAGSEMYKEIPFAASHLQLIRKTFEQNSGEYFLEGLNSKAEEIQGVSEGIWNSIQEEGVHYLPIGGVVHTIPFSQDSVAQMMGINSLELIGSQQEQDWKMAVRFNLNDSPLQLMGNFDSDGNLVFKAPLDTEIPGLYRMLKLITVATMHDLMVQQKAEQQLVKSPTTRRGAQTSPIGTRQQPSDPSTRPGGSLPRTQTDRQLIESVSRARGVSVRTVEVHKTHLKGAFDFVRAVHRYNEGVENGEEDSSIQQLRQQLALAAQRLNQASDEKKNTVPKQLSLETTTNPLDRQERFLETWVITHSVPKPSPEELKSPKILYERYYSRSSSLAFLDQFKPMFVGM